MASRNNQKGSSEKKKGNGGSSAPVDIPQTSRKFHTKQWTPFEDCLLKNQKGSSSSSVAKNVATVNSVDDEGFLAALTKNVAPIRPSPQMLSELKDNLISSNNSTSENWTPEEDTLLQVLLIKYEREVQEIDRYTKIANHLEKKSWFDVAGRVMWLNSKKELRGKEAEPTESSDSETQFHLSP